MTGQKLNPKQAEALNQWADKYAEQGRYSDFLEIINQTAINGWKFSTLIKLFDERLTGKSVPRGPALRTVGRSREAEQAEYAEQARKYKSMRV